MQFDPETFGVAMADLVRSAVAPLKAEIADLRKQLDAAKAESQELRQALADAPTPKNGKDADEAAIAAKVADAVKADLAQWKTEAQDDIKVPELPDIKEMVDQAVSAAVKAIPAPKDGKSVTLDDVRPLIDEELTRLRSDADDYFKAVLTQTERARDGLLKTVADLHQPEDGKSVTVEDVRPMIEAEVKARVAEIPVPADGKSIDPADVERMVHEAVAKIPPAANGKDADPAEIKRLVDEAVAAVPAPKNGKDGIGLAGFLIDRDGCLIATTTTGETKNLGPVIGKDGLSLESFTMEYVSDTHEIVLKASAAGRTEEIRYPAGGIHGKGYWREGFKAKAGDAWTHEGSLWVAMKDTETKPGADQSAWFMAARHGKDGETVVKKVRSGPQPPIKLDDSDKREE